MDKNKPTPNKSSFLSTLLVGAAGVAIGLGAKIFADEYIFNSDKNKENLKEKKQTEKESNNQNENPDTNKNHYYDINSPYSNSKGLNSKTEDGIDEYDSFLCPIGQEIMVDPVITPKGITYERKNISNWLKKNQTCPITKTPLKESDLITNYSLKNAIMEYIKKQDFKNQ